MLTKVPEVFTVFDNLPDPRREGANKRHQLFDLVFIALCGSICGCDSWADVERFGRQNSHEVVFFICHPTPNSRI